MADVSSNLEPGKKVNLGDPLGKTRVYAGPNFGWVTNVHFEIKTKPVIYNPTWSPGLTPRWGYSGTSADNNGYQDPKQFINMSQPPAPIPLSPTKGNKTVSITPEMFWSSDIPWNRIQVSSDIDFEKIVFDEPIIFTNSIQIPEKTLKPETQYWWRVDARNSSGAGFWSEEWDFTTTKNKK